MLKHTKKVREMYEDIQRYIFQMIPERWDKILLYASIMDLIDGNTTGELFFYYIPKGILRKKPINVYEIPKKFNLDEDEYIKVVHILYEKVVNLREEFKKVEVTENTWSNVTMIIDGINFNVEYDYEDLSKSKFSSYERHVIWKYKYLKIPKGEFKKSDRRIIENYQIEGEPIRRRERYDAGIYIKNIENIIDYDSENYLSDPKIEEINVKRAKNQIIMLNDQKLKSNNVIMLKNETSKEEKKSKKTNK